MTIRPATGADEAAIDALRGGPSRGGASDLALVAEQGGRVAGFVAVALAAGEPRVRELLSGGSREVEAALLAAVSGEARTHGADALLLEVAAGDADAQALADRLGFVEVARTVRLPLDELAQRLAGGRLGPSFGSIHIATDDLDAVVRAVQQTVPRLPGGSQGSVAVPSTGGWTGIYDELCDREPAMLRRLARELADRSGAVVLQLGVEDGAVVRFVLYERGRVVDEYCSVPEHHGPLPPGEVIGLAANPTVVARLTGADPGRVREVARTASRPDELPPAPELAAVLAGVLGIPGAAHGYERACLTPGAVPIRR
ncbi:MAG: hypothetical protein R3C15_08005 [Thermoleophilia bacterium]